MTQAQLPEVPKSVQVLDVERLDTYRRGAHVLIPEAKIGRISELYAVHLERVDLSPDPADGDVFQLPGTYNDPKYGLSARAIFKLAHASGIQRMGAKILTATQSYVLAQARVKMRNRSGEWIESEGSYELDLEIIEQDAYEDQKAKMGKSFRGAPKTDEECREKARTAANKIRRHKVARAETGAYCRAIRPLLGVGGGFAPEELHKPFIVAAVHFAPDLTNPSIARAVENTMNLRIARAFGEPGEVQALAERTGQTREQMEADARRIDQLQSGIAEEVHFAQADLVGEDDPAVIAVRGALPPDYPMEEYDYLPYDEEA